MDNERKQYKERIIDAYREKAIEYKQEYYTKKDLIEKLEKEVVVAKNRYIRAYEHLTRCLDSYDKEYGTKETD